MEKRIKEILETSNLTQQSFAELLNISPAGLSNIFNGHSKPTILHVNAIHTAFPDISLEWLLYGVGNKYCTGVPKPENNTNAHKEALHPSLNSLTLKTQKEERLITEIRVFYDDGTFEVFMRK